MGRWCDSGAKKPKKRLCLTNVDMAFDLTPAAIAAPPSPIGRGDFGSLALTVAPIPVILLGPYLHTC